MTATVAIAALLSLLPAGSRRAVERVLPSIIGRTEVAHEVTGVPVETIVAVAWLETRLGTDPRSGGSWGAPVSPRRRGVAGGSAHSARALAWGYRRCVTDLGAVSHYRCGLCVCPHMRGYQPAEAVRLMDRMRSVR